METIQGEGGVNLPPPDYLKGLRELADKHNLLLIFDEVQAGMGRTGRWFAYQHWDVLPDAVTLAKALAGGVACGGLVVRDKYADLLKPGTHAATFGGNPLACRAAPGHHRNHRGRRPARAGRRRSASASEAISRNCKQRCPLIQEIRIQGAMIGVELSVPGAAIVEACLKRQLLINCTHTTVLRLLPALTLSDELIDEGCGILEEVLLAHKT